MEENYKHMLSEFYGLKLINNYRSKGIIICNTNEGVFDLKKIPIETESKILIEDKIKDYLYSKKFNQITKIFKTKDGNSYFKNGDYLYTLENHIETESFNMQMENNLMKAVKVMANLHKASFGCGEFNENSFVNKFPEMFHKKKLEFTRIKNRIKNQKKVSEIDLIFLKNYDYYIDKITSSQKILEQIDYNIILNKAKLNSGISHNNFKGDNLRIDKKGELFVFGFNKASFDYCLVDLSELLRRYMKNEDWNLKQLKIFIDTYSEINPITFEDKVFINSYLLYPSKYISLCNEFYNKRQVHISSSMINRFNVAVDLNIKNDEILFDTSKILD